MAEVRKGQFPEVDALESQVHEWLESINYTLKLDLQEFDPNKGLVEQISPGNPNEPYFVHDNQSQGIYFNIGFSKKITPRSTIQDLRRSFSYVALDSLPMPGFVSPRNWSIRPLTPYSSFQEGVMIKSFENNRIEYSIDTQFFAVSGDKQDDVQKPCGRPSSPGTYFSVENSFRGLININMAMSFK